MKTFLLIICLSLLFIGNAFSCEYTDEEICQSIYIIEGGEKTNFPYGIKSVSCNGKEECKKICLNTVRNNRKRFSDYGYREYKTYLEFLASRYCPKGEYLCENWLGNLKFYLKKGE